MPSTNQPNRKTFIRREEQSPHADQHPGRSPRRYRHSKQEVEQAIQCSRNYSEAMRLLGISVAGGNHRVFKQKVRELQIPTDHFESSSQRAQRTIAHRNRQRKMSNKEWFISGIKRNGGQSKRRLWESGLKSRKCEFCGQGEEWRGRHMGLVLDHIDGDNLNNRLSNLRLLCPNCNATLDTHCGRKNKPPQRCRRGRPNMKMRKVTRPPRDSVLLFVAEHGYEAAGRNWGVSGNAVRKWIKKDIW